MLAAPGDEPTSRAADLAMFQRELYPRYGAACLVGATVRQQGRTFNSACLIGPGGVFDRHDKLKLIVLAETLPEGIPVVVRGWLQRVFRIQAPYVPGESYHPLTIVTRNGARLCAAVSLCYEMHFPFLPQYRHSEETQMVIHMTDESWFAGFAGHPLHGTWACQYRAIETRRWQLVCANWSNSAVIDPRGRVCAICSLGPGVIDTLPWTRADSPVSEAAGTLAQEASR